MVLTQDFVACCFVLKRCLETSYFVQQLGILTRHKLSQTVYGVSLQQQRSYPEVLK